MKIYILVLAVIFLFAFRSEAQKVTDYDGNSYDTVQIGSLIWLRPNLRTTHYSNGVPIPQITDSTMWTHSISGARCYYDNDSAACDTLYGALYNYFVVIDTNHVCPLGWHVSTNNEWLLTENYLGGGGVAGGKMKEAGTQHWLAPNYGATNSTGFTGLPGGARFPYDGTFQYVNENGIWWTSTVYNISSAWSTYLWYMNEGVDHNPVPKRFGLNIRCVKDQDLGTGETDHPEKVRIYPNPARSNVVVELGDAEEVTLDLYNMLGERILSRTMNEWFYEMDVSLFPPGIYLVRVYSAGWTAEQKLVKE